jgi:outer membrane protein TolC
MGRGAFKANYWSLGACALLAACGCTASGKSKPTAGTATNAPAVAAQVSPQIPVASQGESKLSTSQALSSQASASVTIPATFVAAANSTKDATPPPTAAQAVAFAPTTSVNFSPAAQAQAAPSASSVRLAPPEPVQAMPLPPVVPDEVVQPIPVAGGAAPLPLPLAPTPPHENVYPIDLPTALQLADAGNYQVMFAREQIRQSWAQVQAARVLWLPSINSGVGYNKHEGQIQQVDGTVFATSRGSFYGGLGALMPGAASPTVPGIYSNFRLADALFKPLVAQQGANAKRFAAGAATNDILLKVSLAYVELLRASADRAIARETRENAQQLADLTAAYARSGQGLQSDADRTMTELAVRENDVSRAKVAVQIASARLAQLLRLNTTVLLNPSEPTVLPIDMVSPDVAVGELVAQGLNSRPEMAENRALVAQAVARMRQERYAVFMPSLLLGASYGAFGGGLSDTIANIGNRMDTDVVAYWQVRNLGFGEAAARAETRSLANQATVNRLYQMDLVAREVVEAHAQVAAGRDQISTSEKAVAAASASHHHNVQRILQAKGLPIEVLQSNQALAQAQREYLRSVTDYNAAQFTLYRALGWPTAISKTPIALSEPKS